VAKTISTLLPPTSELLARFGERLRLARLRRRLGAKQVAERAGMVPMTLRSVERGGAGVTIGAYLAVMQVLGIEKDLEQLAATDPLGRALQDARLPVRKGASSSLTQKPEKQVAPASKLEKLAARGRDRPWAEQSGFVSSAALASLLEPDAPRAKKRR
jgi:transcriptional regulator with XRE-family HTH domain